MLLISNGKIKNVRNNELKFQIEAVVKNALTEIPNTIENNRVSKLEDFCRNLTAILEKMQREGKMEYGLYTRKYL